MRALENDKLFCFFAYALFIVLHLAFAKMKMGLALWAGFLSGRFWVEMFVL
jgi:hypothetical protein